MNKEDNIVVRGAAEHNLAHIDLDLPKNQLICFSGVSGSGKSSLAFDTLFREGQRRYLENLSGYARGFMRKMARAEVARLEGLPAALAVDQRGITPSSRATVGTLSEISDYLRLLYARLGEAHCLSCGTHLTSRSPQTLYDNLVQRFAGRNIEIYAPVVHDHRGARKALFERLIREGIEDVRIDGQSLSLQPVPHLDEAQRHTIEALIDRLTVAPLQRARLEKALAWGLRLGNQVLHISVDGETERHDTQHACPNCGTGFPHLGERLFSFNSPHGACPACKGLGVEDHVDPNLLIADPNKTLRQGAMVPTTPNGYIVYSQVTVDVMNQICQVHGFDVDTPWNQLTEEQQQVIFFGTDKLKVPFGKHALESRMKWSGITAKPREEGYYRGLIPVIRETLARDRNKNILRFVRSVPCSNCKGSRLRAEATTVTLAGQTIVDLNNLSLEALALHLQQPLVTEARAAIAAPILASLQRRIELLIRLGLGYLTPGRPSTSLSGGEGRRIRLAGQVLSGLQDLLYVMDEPGTGLHWRDKANLHEILCQLRDEGNTVIQVEHDPRAMSASDWLVELGPGAGKEGGQLIFAGAPQDIEATGPTGAFLTGVRHIPVPATRRQAQGMLVVRDAHAHNLQHIDATFKLGTLNAVSGVSGSGKSTLVDQILARALLRRLHGARTPAAAHGTIEGINKIKKVIHIDQSPIGRTPRSNPATYTGLFDHVRTLFAQQPLAREKGWKKGHFSTNTKGGRCNHCEGAGQLVVGMHGLPDVVLPCEACNGARYEADTLAVCWRGHNIAQVLSLTVAEAIPVFTDETKPLRILEMLRDLGLHYLTLGQSSLTLSGGEAQRVKLASELSRVESGQVLYILDEPTSGLHPADIEVLLAALNALVDKGHTVIVIEHHLDVLKSADHLLDLGPEGGDQGGRLVASGTPEEVARTQTHTGQALRQLIFESDGQPLPHRPGQVKRRPIRMEGVTTHNLKNIDVTLPHGQLTVVTGLSGSGKSSLVFDTLYAEGRRRFAEGLTTQARRYLGKGSGGSARRIEGLTPTIAIGRSRGGAHARSTVGTASGLYDSMRLLFARAGTGAPAGTVLSARHFSFNHTAGSCPTCGGLGHARVTDPDRLISHPQRSLFEGAMAGHKPGLFYGDPHGQYLATLAQVGAELGLDFEQPWCALDPALREIALRGTGERIWNVTWRFKRGNREGEHHFDGPWQGLASLVEEEYARKAGEKRGEPLAELMMEAACDACGGSRLNPLASSIEVAGLSLPRVSQLPLDELYVWLENQAAVDPISAEIWATAHATLRALLDAGLGYLTLARAFGSLSGGEAQRVRLAAQLSGGLSGITYVLDEPTVGLHAAEVDRLLGVLRDLVLQGNTVVVVEHDVRVIEAADHLIELGPGAGEAGGYLVGSGSPAELKKQTDSLTGKYLRGELSFPKLEWPAEPPRIRIVGADCHNLQQLDVTLPGGGLTAISGPSGSGKSTLIFDVLAASAVQGKPVGCARIEGLEHFAETVCLTQATEQVGGSLLGYLGLLDRVRTHFANSEGARKLGLKKAHFSPTGKDGRCNECKGQGWLKTEMSFMDDVLQPCESCNGKRFNNLVLACSFKGFSIADAMELSFAEARQFFDEDPRLREAFEILNSCGLNHLRLGRDTRSLSGGEFQRVRLAHRLLSAKKERLLFLLDEPTTGLHAHDVAQLLNSFAALIEQGHTLIVIEHHPAVLAAAHHHIELGPGGGIHGGRIEAQKTRC